MRFVTRASSARPATRLGLSRAPRVNVPQRSGTRVISMRATEGKPRINFGLPTGQFCPSSSVSVSASQKKAHLLCPGTALRRTPMSTSQQIPIRNTL